MKIDYDNSGIEYLKAQEIPQLFQDITDIFVDSQQHINHSHQLIEAGTIKQDPKQDRVLELIDQLYVQIESYSPPSLPSKPCPNCASGTFNKPRQETKTQKRSLWNSFFGSSETKNSQIKPFYNSSHINIPHIYIYGGTGTGKTMLTDILYECLTTNSKQRVHFNKFMLELHDEIHRRTRESGKSADDVLPELSLNIAKKSQIFYIDEFQVDNLVDALLLNRLFTSLFYYGVIFFFTSNREPENLYLNGLQRTAAWEPFLKLFKSRCSIIDLNTINYRDVEDGFGYFIDNDPTSFSEGRLQFENAWAAICGIEESKTIQVMAGRKLICPRSSKNIATRFNFGELCETNKGSADYIAVKMQKILIIKKMILMISNKILMIPKKNMCE
eukprot:359159_1